MAGDNEVGYAKPPKHTRFRKGRSGNPKGRPKGAKNLSTDLLEELGERIVIREGNREIRVSKQRALLKSQTARGLKGDNRAAGQIIDLYLKVIGLEVEAAEANMPLSADERAVVANLEERILRKAGIAAPVDRRRPDKATGGS